MSKRNHLAGLLLLLPLLLCSHFSDAQSVGIGTPTPDAKAALDIRASDRGLLIPRLTAAQRGGITAPPQGLLVYQTDAPEGFYYFAGSPGAWVFLNPAGGGGDNLGNHTAMTNLNLGANALVGTGASVGTAVGLGVRADGGLNLGQNTAGNNFFVGYQAGQSTTPGTFTGVSNQFVGYRSGLSNTTGTYNQFTGRNSGYSNTIGTSNQFSGYYSGFSNTTGNYNQFSGSQSGYSNSTGSSNHFEGFNSGYYNTTGSSNYFSGYYAGLNNTTGFSNYFSGYQSGYSNTTGIENQFIGFQSGYNNTTGSRNVFIGFGAGNGNRTGDTNYAIGYGAGPIFDGLDNAGAIGYMAQVGIGNALALGGTGVNAIRVGIGTTSPAYPLEVIGQVKASSFTTTSDQRLKNDVRPLRGALTGVLALRGVRYTWNELGVQHGGTAGQQQVGLIAQELEKVYPELVSTDPKGYKSVNYAQLAPVLIEALKEQQAQIEALQQRAAAAEAAAAAQAKACQATEALELRLRRLEASSTQALR